MAYGGMVHALEEIHRLLKPTGRLIDIHPVPVPSPVEIHQGGQIDVAGQLLVRQWYVDFQEADNALGEIVRRGRFAVERDVVFDSLTHYASAEELRTSVKESIEKFARDAQSARESVPHAEALAMRADELMRAAAGEAELIVREPTRISRLRPT